MVKNADKREAIIKALIAGDKLTLCFLTGKLPPMKIVYKRLGSNIYYLFEDGTGQLTPEQLSKFWFRVNVVIPEEGCYMPKIANCESEVEL